MRFLNLSYFRAVDCHQNSARNAGRYDQTFERYVLPLAEVVDEHQCGDCQQVEDMHTDRQTQSQI